jgi:hypothetical protein
MYSKQQNTKIVNFSGDIVVTVGEENVEEATDKLQQAINVVSS